MSPHLKDEIQTTIAFLEDRAEVMDRRGWMRLACAYQRRALMLSMALRKEARREEEPLGEWWDDSDPERGGEDA